MILFGLALFATSAGAEPCSVVRREQAEVTAGFNARLERLNRQAKRPDGSIRPLTNSERKEFAAIEAEVEAFIDRFNSRLANCRKDA